MTIIFVLVLGDHSLHNLDEDDKSNPEYVDLDKSNPDYVDLDMFVYREVDKHESATLKCSNVVTASQQQLTPLTTVIPPMPTLSHQSQAIINSLLSQQLPLTSQCQPSTDKLLNILATGKLAAPPLGVSLPTNPLPFSVVFPTSCMTSMLTSSCNSMINSVANPSHTLPITTSTGLVQVVTSTPHTHTQPVTVPQCTVLQLPTSNIRVEMEVIDTLWKSTPTPTKTAAKRTTVARNRKVNLKKRKSISGCGDVELNPPVKTRMERSSCDSLLAEIQRTTAAGEKGAVTPPSSPENDKITPVTAGSVILPGSKVYVSSGNLVNSSNNPGIQVLNSLEPGGQAWLIPPLGTLVKPTASSSRTPTSSNASSPSLAGASRSSSPPGGMVIPLMTPPSSPSVHNKPASSLQSAAGNRLILMFKLLLILFYFSFLYKFKAIVSINRLAINQAKM